MLSSQSVSRSNSKAVNPIDDVRSKVNSFGLVTIISVTAFPNLGDTTSNH